MGALLLTPSNGKSEVLETLRYQGAIAAGVKIVNLGPMVSHRWQGDEGSEGSDTTFEADILTVLVALQTAGYVIGRNDSTGATVDLSSTPPKTTRVVLTGAGRHAARAPRPRPNRVSQ